MFEWDMPTMQSIGKATLPPNMLLQTVRLNRPLYLKQSCNT